MADDIVALEELIGLKLDSLEQLDIAALNLGAARGLPGTDSVDCEAALDCLDDWADRVKLEIWRHIYRFNRRSLQPPTEFTYGNSLGRFFCYFLLQVLQEDCGVVYHPDRKFNPDYCQPQDLFIHGIVGENGRGGTCASMPVVYVAVGRRLGLPLYLVEGRGHLFFRWDAPKGTTIHWDGPELHLWIPPDRFNVEGSGEGIAYYPDSHYIQWPELWKEVDFRHGRYLRSLTAREELAGFLIQRGECFYDLGCWQDCLKAMYLAVHLVPEDERYKWLHSIRSREFLAEQERELEMLREFNEPGWRNPAKRRGGFHPNPAQHVKIAYGTSPPVGLPASTPIQYVPPDQADLLPGGLPVPGRIYKIRADRPRPACLPPYVPVQYVTPWEADDLSPYEPESPWEQNATASAAVIARENLEMLQIVMERKSQHSLRYGSPAAASRDRIAPSRPQVEEPK